MCPEYKLLSAYAVLEEGLPISPKITLFARCIIINLVRGS
jgi:hypothetical protein